MSGMCDMCCDGCVEDETYFKSSFLSEGYHEPANLDCLVML